MVFNLLFFNRCFDKGRLKDLVLWSFQNSGETATLELVEKLKDLGFQYATNAGISLSLDDLKTPPNSSTFSIDRYIKSGLYDGFFGSTWKSFPSSSISRYARTYG